MKLSIASTALAIVSLSAVISAKEEASSSSGCPKWQKADPMELMRSGAVGCQSNAACDANLANRDGQIPPTEWCCVNFNHVYADMSYCGVPADCNAWLKCKTQNDYVQVPVSAEEVTLDAEDFQMKFSKLANCPNDATSLDNCTLPVMDDAPSSGGGMLGAGRSSLVMAAIVAGFGFIFMQ